MSHTSSFPVASSSQPTPANAPRRSFRDRFVSTPVFFPHLPIEPVLESCRALGFTKFEGFVEWATARLDWRGDPAGPRRLAESMGLTFSSFHLPTVRGEVEAELENLLIAARYAVGLGAKVVLFKAASKGLYARVGRRFLDALEAEKLELTPVLQNHLGSPIATIDDYRDVLSSLDDDPRMKTLLEVGHFHRAGISWREGWDYMGERIALIHVNEILEGKSVCYGSGEVDFRGLMKQVKTSGYTGNIVIELELPTRETAAQETLDGVRGAVALLEEFYEQS